MKPRERREAGETDLFRSRLDQIINMNHELVRLVKSVSWEVIEARSGEIYSDGPGMPPLAARLMAGLAILKHTFNLSDEELCARWVESPYFQYLCGEEFFRHDLPFDRSSMTRWRQRMGEDRIAVLLQESRSVAVHTLKTYLGRTIRDITQQIAGEDDLQDIFRKPLHLASRVLEQRQNQQGKKIYSLHAPEAECIGKGKAHAPYEFGVKVPVATTLHRSKGGQFALHAKALPGSPYDGHTLATIISGMEATIGNGLERILADTGYRGHNAPLSHRFRVYTSGQKRRMTLAIKREMKRRAAVEPVIGHIKNGHRMDRNYLSGTQGDAINAILAAAGYNFRLLLTWLRLLLSLIISAILSRSHVAGRLQIA